MGRLGDRIAPDGTVHSVGGHARGRLVTRRVLLLHNPRDVTMIRRNGQVNEVQSVTTVTQAAEFLGVCPQRVHDFIAEGRLKAHKVNPRLYLIDTAELQRFAAIPRETGNPQFRKKRKSR